MIPPSKCNIYQVEIDTKGRKVAANFNDIYKYIRLDIYEEMDYSVPGQIPISYFFSNEIVNCDQEISGFDVTGYVDTSREVWFHPPRGGDYFRQLELNPYPYLKNKISEWNWQLRVDSSWGDDKWREWEGIITLDFQYSSRFIENLRINGLILNCFEVRSTSNSLIGSTKSIFYFSNINNKKTLLKSINHLMNGDVLTLINVTHNDSFNKSIKI